MIHDIMTVMVITLVAMHGWGGMQLWKEQGELVAAHLCNVEHIDVGGRHSCHSSHKAADQLLRLCCVKWPARTLRHHQAKNVVQHKGKPFLPSCCMADAVLCMML